MISILIPIYNFDVTNLVNEIYNQAYHEKIDFEIILIDDASEDKFRKLNRKLSELKNVNYSEESSNTGRSKIRNKLAMLAKFQYMLFIDCDSQIINNDFIHKYLSFCINGNIACGGRIYQDYEPENSEFQLHWKYGKSREEFSVQTRNQTPNKSFMTNNFLISKSLFNSIKFNEEINGYGHEDTHFGHELKKKNVFITHINNPLLHIGLETSSKFLDKTKEGIKNLKYILLHHANEKAFVKDVKLLNSYYFFKRIRFVKLIRFLFQQLSKKFEKNLLGKNPRLLILDIYKLGYLCSLNEKH